MRKNDVKKGVIVGIATMFITMAVVCLDRADDAKEIRLERALSEAVSTVDDEGSKGYQKNQVIALFIQSILNQVDDDIDLTVRILKIDNEAKTVDVEAKGEYNSNLYGKRHLLIQRSFHFA